MNPLASHAQAILRDHPHPALPLHELLEMIAERFDRGLDSARLRAVLKEYPEAFKLVEPWNGPWLFLDPSGADHPCDEMWVVLLTPPDSRAIGHDPTVWTLRESVRWLARDLDPRSRADVSRWYSIVMAEREARLRLQGRAA